MHRDECRTTLIRTHVRYAAIDISAPLSSVAPMKASPRPSALPPFNPRFRVAPRRPSASHSPLASLTPARFRTPRPIDPLYVADAITFVHPEVLDALACTIHHPRSLSRPVDAWYPPSLTLPKIEGNPAARATVARHRVGPWVRAHVRACGENRQPTYLVSVRFSSPTDADLPTGLAEAWIRALIGGDVIDAVHEAREGTDSVFLWLVDSHFAPVRSPAFLFQGLSNAA